MDRKYNKSEKALLPIPKSLSKKIVNQLYPEYGSRFINSEIVEIQRKAKEVPKDEIKCRNKVTRKDLMKLIELIGWPIGYEKFFRD